jgi:predicted phosphodiesterase
MKKYKIKVWTPEEEKFLKTYTQMSWQEIQRIATSLGRTPDCVDHKRRRLGIPYVKEEISSKKNTDNKQKDADKRIIQCLKDELATVEPYKVNSALKMEIKGDTLVIHLTDWHGGKIVKDQEGKLIYNEEIFKVRIKQLCEQILSLLDNNISKGVPIKEVVIISTGDLANGEGIYATQAYEQEIAPPKQVMLVVDVIIKLIMALLERKLSVQFVGVRGNHGRTGKDTDIASNWDLMIYMIIELWARTTLKNPNFQIKYTESEQLRFDIRGHGYLIRHIAPEQVDSPSGRVKINEWARQYNVKAIVYGHFHHAGVFDCDDIKVFRGGSTVGGDSLSDSMAKHSEPEQLVWGVNDKRVSSFIYFVDLGNKK